MKTFSEVGMQQKEGLRAMFDALAVEIPEAAAAQCQELREAALGAIDFWYGTASELAASGRATDRWHDETGVRVDFRRLMELMQDEVGRFDDYRYEFELEQPEDGEYGDAPGSSIVDDAEAVVDMAMATETAMRPRIRIGDARRMAEHLNGDAPLYVISTVPGLSPIRGVFAAKGCAGEDADCLVLTDYDVEADPGALSFLGGLGVDVDWTAGHGRE